MTVETTTGVHTRQPNPWVMLFVGTLGIFAALGLARFGYSTVLPEMQAALGIGDLHAGVIASANLVGYLLLALIGGALASRYGTRRVASLGLVVAGAGMVMTGLAHNLFSICCWRLVTGLGSGAANVAIMGMWTAWFSSKLRGRVAGIAVTGSSWALIYTGVIVPPLLTIPGHLGWRLCWFLFGGVALLVAVLAWAVLRDRVVEAAQDAGETPAIPGRRAGETPAIPGRRAGETPAIPGRRAGETPAIPGWTDVYRMPAVWGLGLVYTAFGFSYIIYMTFFKKFLIGAPHGFSPADAMRLFMLLGVCSLFCFVWGIVSDHLGRKAALAVVFLIQSAAFAIFAISGGWAGLIASTVLFGLTAWSIPAIMAAACGDLLGARFSAAALGFVTLFFGIGQAAGPSVAGALAQGHGGSFVPAFLLAAGVAFIGAVATLALPGRGTERIEKI